MNGAPPAAEEFGRRHPLAVGGGGRSSHRVAGDCAGLIKVRVLNDSILDLHKSAGIVTVKVSFVHSHAETTRARENSRMTMWPEGLRWSPAPSSLVGHTAVCRTSRGCSASSSCAVAYSWCMAQYGYVFRICLICDPERFYHLFLFFAAAA